MPTLPEWVIIVLAILSAITIRAYFGGVARVLARVWVIAFYAFLWVGSDNYDLGHMVSLSRYGLALLFLSDIIPALAAVYQRKHGAKSI